MIPASSDGFKRGGVVNGKATFKKKVLISRLTARDVTLTGSLMNENLSMTISDKLYLNGDVEVDGMITAGNLIVNGNILPSDAAFNSVTAADFRGDVANSSRASFSHGLISHNSVRSDTYQNHVGTLMFSSDSNKIDVH